MRASVDIKPIVSKNTIKGQIDKQSRSYYGVILSLKRAFDRMYVVESLRLGRDFINKNNFIRIWLEVDTHR